MSYFLLLIIGFIFAAYIYNTRYSALSHITEFILCLEKIAPEKLFGHNKQKTMINEMSHLDLKAPLWILGVDMDDLFRKDPKILAGDLYISRERILQFLSGRCFPNDEYFRITTDTIYDLLEDYHSIETKRKFVVEVLTGNVRVRDMATSICCTGQWSSSEEKDDQTRGKFREFYAKLDENQLDQIVLSLFSLAKTELISLTESIKEGYVESLTNKALKSKETKGDGSL